jgi:Transmembrane domain of unknown function (DUF3566)
MTDPRYPSAAGSDETTRIPGEPLNELRSESADDRSAAGTNGRSVESRPARPVPAVDPHGRPGWSAAAAGPSSAAAPGAGSGPPSDATRAVNGQNGYAARGYSAAGPGAGAARPAGDGFGSSLSPGSYGAGYGTGSAAVPGAAGYGTGATPAAPTRSGSAAGYGAGSYGGSSPGYGAGADPTTAYSGSAGYGAATYGAATRGDVDSPSSVGIPMGASTTGTGPFVGGATLNRGGARPARPSGPRPARRARLTLRQIDPWSTFKFSLVLAVAMFFVWLVAIGVLYGVLDGIGVFGRINDLYGELAGNQDGKALITPGLVLGLAALVGAVNIVLTTALATIGAFVYNICADLVGGIEVTLAERD